MDTPTAQTTRPQPLLHPTKAAPVADRSSRRGRRSAESPAGVHTLALIRPFLGLIAALALAVLMAVPAQAAASDRAGGVAETSSIASGAPARPRGVSPDRWAALKAAVQQAKLLPTPTGVAGSGGEFGFSVSVDGARALVGGRDLAGSGAAVVFEDVGGTWQEVAILVPSDGAEDDRFGQAVSLSGARALVGAHWADPLGDASGAAYVFDFDGSEWSESAKLLPSDGAAGEEFGYSVSLDGSRALIGAQFDDENGSFAGAAYVFDFDGANWQETAKLLPIDGASGDVFGYAVSLSAERALIGARNDDDLGSNAGSAYVFDFDGTAWTETDKLQPLDGASGDRFGHAVSLSGTRALIGAYQDDDLGFASGSAYVFDFDGVDWSETTKLLPADGASSDQFGWTVSLSADRALIGAYGNDDLGSGSGSAYVFDFDGTSWSETEKLLPLDGASGDRFGQSVSLSGSRALVGASLDDDDGTDSGSAYVFDFDGAAWNETAKLRPGQGSRGDEFGFAVSLSEGRALVGARSDDDFGSNSGSAYVFDFDGIQWTLTAKLLASDGAAGDLFGYSVSLDGSRALIGASGDDETFLDQGSVYVFEFNGVEWMQTAKLLASDPADSDYFGHVVSLSSGRALIGAYWDDDNGADSGSAYVFEFDGSTWGETAKLLASDGAADDEFGWSAALSGNRALIGSPEDDDNGSRSGSVYVYDFDGTSWIETKLLPLDGNAGDRFGYAVSLAGSRALIGALFDDDLGTSSGSAYVFDFDGTTWNETKLLAGDGAASDEFGIAVSVDGDRALVGATGNDDNGSNSGSAYLFEFDGVVWTQTEKLLPVDGSTGDQFGIAVSVGPQRSVVGSYSDDDHGSESGSAYVFGANQPPVAQDDLFDGLEDQLVVGNVFDDNGNGPDVDPEGVLEVQSPGTLATAGLAGSVDLAVDGDFVFTPPADGFGIATFGYTVVDSGGETDSATVTITVAPVNDPPTFTASDPTELEDAGAVAIPGWASFDPGAANETDNALAYTVSGISNPGLFVALPTVDPAGTLFFEAVADISGTSSFDVVVQDDGGTANGGEDTSAPQTFTLTILPVNDAPTFTAVDPPPVPEDAGEQFVAGWATFDDGSPNESDSVLAYQVSGVSNPALFLVPPEVDLSGNLSFLPAGNAFGTSTFDVVVQDDGGTANFGVDTSDPQTFTITVEPVNDPPTFTTGPSPSFSPGAAGPQTEVGWIQNLDLGPNEPDALLDYIVGVTGDPNGVLQTIDVTDAGDLVYTLSGASGVAEFTVQAQDDGGTLNGGQDTSATAFRQIRVLFDPPEGAFSWWWGSSFPELYSPGETCCFDLTGDGVVDDAWGGVLASLNGLISSDFNDSLTAEYENGNQVHLMRWVEAPVLGVAGDVEVNILPGSWFGAAGFADREMGLGEYLLQELPPGDSGAPTLQGSVAADGSLALTGDRIPFPFQFLDASLDTVLRDVVAEGQVTDSAVDCNGLCSVDDVDAGRVPPEVGGLRVGGALLLDDYLEASDAAIRDCSCSGIDSSQPALIFGENLGTNTYEVECTDSVNNADFGACPVDGFCELVDTLCTTIGIFPQSADLDFNGNGILDAFSVGERIGFAGANVVGCEGNDCTFPTNQPPVAQPDAVTTFEDTALNGNVLVDNGAGPDVDPDGDALTVTTAGSFPAAGLGGTVDLQATGAFSYTPPADATGQASFDYTIADPSGETDSATVTIDVQAAADLVIDKISNSFFTPPGSAIDYEILVVNAGPSDVTGATVTDTPPAALSGVTWTCTAFDGASCQDAGGTDLIDQSVTLPDGSSLLYLLSGTTPPDSNDPITNTASVANPIAELDGSNNSDSDTDLVGLFADGWESEEP